MHDNRILVDPQLFVYRLCVIALLFINVIALCVTAAGVWRLAPTT